MERFIIYDSWGQYDDYTGDQPVGYFASAEEALSACKTLLETDKPSHKAYSYQVTIVKVTDDGYYGYAYTEDGKIIINEIKTIELGELHIE